MGLRSLALGAVLLAGAGLAACDRTQQNATAPHAISAADVVRTAHQHQDIDHVLLISIDGIHQTDVDRFVKTHPHSALARLVHTGINYHHAQASRPSDSFPGLLALITGGTPRSTGVYYDVSYDRRLSPPGSACHTRGATVAYDESIDIDNTRLDAGGGINVALLPLDRDHGCKPVFPHSFLRVNTIFEVAKAKGLRTAWSDKHPTYDIVNGPSGHGVDDLFTPEIVATLPDGNTGETNVVDAEYYDDIKVNAVLHWIEGDTHDGTAHVGVPAIFGMNFQAVSVGQKTVGYTDAAGRPTAALEDAFVHTDASIGAFLDELDERGLLSKTLVILSAKHGQTPIDRALKHIVADSVIPTQIDAAAPGAVAQATEDDIALVWLTHQSKTAAAVQALKKGIGTNFLQSVLSGDQVEDLFADPTKDSRPPDLVGVPIKGVIYTGLSDTKIAEHGGFNDEDRDVPIIASIKGLVQRDVWTPVQTRQVAPSILRALDLNPFALEAVQIEGTTLLPEFDESLQAWTTGKIAVVAAK